MNRAVFHSTTKRRAFTLIEVLLAVVIMAGLLSIVLFFYQQASNLRTELLQEADRISSARLLMDRITTELRCARRHSYFETPLVGDSSSIQFMTTAFPSGTPWAGERLGRLSRPETDLKLVRYGTASGEDGTNVVGLTRAEEPLVELRTVNRMESVTFTEDSPTTNRTRGTVITEQLRALRFRYWSGTTWEDSWNAPRLPAAVEVTLATEFVLEEDPSIEPSEQLFRRVIYLPGSAVQAAASAATFPDDEFGDLSLEVFP